MTGNNNTSEQCSFPKKRLCVHFVVVYMLSTGASPAVLLFAVITRASDPTNNGRVLWFERCEILSRTLEYYHDEKVATLVICMFRAHSERRSARRDTGSKNDADMYMYWSWYCTFTKCHTWQVLNLTQTGDVHFLFGSLEFCLSLAGNLLTTSECKVYDKTAMFWAF